LELTGTILNAHVEKRKTKFGDKDYAVVEFSDGNTYGTFKDAVAAGADAFKVIGVPNTTIEVQQNGDYWNFVRVVSPGTDAAGVPLSNGSGTGPITITTTGATPATSGATLPPRKNDRNIHLQTAGKVAAMAQAQSMDEEEFNRFLDRIEQLADLFDGVKRGTPEWAE